MSTTIEEQDLDKLKKFVSAANLEQFFSAFRTTCGVNNIRGLTRLNDQELTAIGLRELHKRRLAAALRDLRGPVTVAAAASSTTVTRKGPQPTLRGEPPNLSAARATAPALDRPGSQAQSKARDMSLPASAVSSVIPGGHELRSEVPPPRSDLAERPGMNMWVQGGRNSEAVRSAQAARADVEKVLTTLPGGRAAPRKPEDTMDLSKVSSGTVSLQRTPAPPPHQPFGFEDSNLEEDHVLLQQVNPSGRGPPGEPPGSPLHDRSFENIESVNDISVSAGEALLEQRAAVGGLLGGEQHMGGPGSQRQRRGQSVWQGASQPCEGAERRKAVTWGGRLQHEVGQMRQLHHEDVYAGVDEMVQNASRQLFYPTPPRGRRLLLSRKT
ncbi:hypothetical protein CYMTET_56269 [Cymbomonas tetramitiformis]|uniref:non-specific protein-tyrosine kinase n=1 Tax=Cymbomonas tetramitiformis TaxID=36881 RepID=A0AAE0BBA7_9CHLO|nr:hypothetical protein CYMTET_56269 [Cymbomonas tetramitiformis]